MPNTRWTWRQSWYDLLFAHWPVPATELRKLVPEGLEIQEFDGTSWVGVVPFRMAKVGRRPLPPLPGLSAFPELNLRLYVERDAKPGVWFVSLDAANAPAVWAAKRYFHLPYWIARMKHAAVADAFEFDSHRLATSSTEALWFQAKYRPISPVYEAQPGTLEHFLTERYCLYARSSTGDIYRGEVHHVPWPLQRAEAEIFTEELVRPHGIKLQGPPPLLHFSRGVDVVVWPFQRISQR